MNNYMFSAHKNGNAELNRRDKMQRLNNRPLTVQEYEDAEQIAALEQWRIDHPNGNYTGYIVLIVIGVLSISLYAYGRYVKREAIAATFRPCSRCHVATSAPKPIIKNLSQYKRIQRGKPIAKDAKALAELREQEFIVSQLMGK